MKHDLGPPIGMLPLAVELRLRIHASSALRPTTEHGGIELTLFCLLHTRLLQMGVLRASSPIYVWQRPSIIFDEVQKGNNEV